jgi:hypothetical protein
MQDGANVVYTSEVRMTDILITDYKIWHRSVLQSSF